jgi:hypothetical protein
LPPFAKPCRPDRMLQVPALRCVRPALAHVPALPLSPLHLLPRCAARGAHNAEPFPIFEALIFFFPVTGLNNASNNKSVKLFTRATCGNARSSVTISPRPSSGSPLQSAFSWRCAP